MDGSYQGRTFSSSTVSMGRIQRHLWVSFAMVSCDLYNFIWFKPCYSIYWLPIWSSSLDVCGVCSPQTGTIRSIDDLGFDSRSILLLVWVYVFVHLPIVPGKARIVVGPVCYHRHLKAIDAQGNYPPTRGVE